MGTRRTALYQDVGDTGLNTSGWGEIGDEFMREWQGATEKAKRVREMLYNSAVVGALRLAVEMPIRAIEWQFVSDEGENDPRLALLADALDAMSHSWEDHITDALGFLWYGWSMFTVTYQADGGRILWRKLRPLGPDTLQRWLFADDGGLEGIQQWPHLWPEPVPIERMVIYRFRRARGNPEGESLLRPAWPSWYYVKNIQQIEAIGIERDLAGLPRVRMPQDADTTESDDPTTDVGKARLMARNVRNDEQGGVVLPFGWDFDLVASPGAAKVDTDVVISRYNKQILMSALSQFLMLGMDNVGALATFQGANDFFTLTLNAVADTIAETFTKFAVERLLALNGYEPTGIRLEHSPAGSVQPALIAEALAKLLAAGAMTMTAEDEVWLRGLFRLPPREVADIEAERDAEAADRRERAAAMAQALQQRGAGQPGQPEPPEPPDGVDRQSAELWAETFAADGDDAYRRRIERQWQKKMGAFLAKQGRQVVRDAKREARAGENNGVNP